MDRKVDWFSIIILISSLSPFDPCFNEKQWPMLLLLKQTNKQTNSQSTINNSTHTHNPNQFILSKV